MDRDHLIFLLEKTVEWRARCASRYPNDVRNADAVTRLKAIAAELANGDFSAEIAELEAAVFPFVDTLEHEEFLASIDYYHGSAGFRSFPADASEYLHRVIEMAKEAALEAA